jgi:LemA protein
MNPTLLVGILALGIVLFVISVYNDLVTLKARIKASIQEIGNQLKRQAELIPNLEESAKGFLKHEKDLFKLITDARKSVTSAVESADLGQMAQAGEKVASLLPKIQAVFESTPEIKGSDIVSRLMDELRDTSDKVMYSRRTLIDLTADYNIKLMAFPTNIVASLFSFQSEKGLDTPTSGSHLEVSSADTQAPKVKL